MSKRKPKEYQPTDCRLIRVATHAKEVNLTPSRIYQKFEEGDDSVEIVLVDGFKMVKIENSPGGDATNG